MNEKTKYEITCFDYNDVFSRDVLEFESYDKAVQYVENGIKPQFRKNFSWIGSDPDSYVSYIPVSDENGNEIDSSDPKYDEYNEQQELRIELGYTIQEVED